MDSERQAPPQMQAHVMTRSRISTEGLSHIAANLLHKLGDAQEDLIESGKSVTVNDLTMLMHLASELSAELTNRDLDEKGIPL